MPSRRRRQTLRCAALRRRQRTHAAFAAAAAAAAAAAFRPQPHTTILKPPHNSRVIRVPTDGAPPATAQQLTARVERACRLGPGSVAGLSFQGQPLAPRDSLAAAGVSTGLGPGARPDEALYPNFWFASAAAQHRAIARVSERGVLSLSACLVSSQHQGGRCCLTCACRGACRLFQHLEPLAVNDQPLPSLPLDTYTGTRNKHTCTPPKKNSRSTCRGRPSARPTLSSAPAGCSRRSRRSC